MVNKHARNSDPYTSKLSAEDIAAQTAADRARVYGVFKEHHPRPLADFELEELLGGQRNGKWRKRRSDLKNEGLLIAVDEIINPHTRKHVIRWGLKEGALVAVAIEPTLLTLMQGRAP